MKNKIVKVITLLALTMGLGIGATKVDAYSVEQKQLYNYGTQWNIVPKVIVAHESGNDNNKGANALDNEYSYMSRVWRESGGQTVNAHYFVGSGGRVIQMLPETRQAFHAGQWANMNGIGVELARTDNKLTFAKDYMAYINLIRDIGKRRGIPMTLDTSQYTGVKSHLWVSNNIWGDHSDPYGYLSRMGISKTQFAKDLSNGVGKPTEVKPVKPSVPNKPSAETTTLKKGDKVSVTKAINYDNGKSFYASGTYNVIEVKGQRVVIGKGNVVTTAIHFNNLKRSNGTVTTPVKPKPVPAKPNPNSSGLVKENGSFTPSTAIIVRYGSSTGYKVSGTLYQGQTIRYNSYIVSGGYVWIKYESFSGTRYLPVREVSKSAWGSFGK